MISQPSPYLQEIEHEAKVASEVVTRKTPQFLKTLDLVSESYLAQVLIAVWDSGLYEYVRQHGAVEIGRAAAELGLDAEVLGSLIEYLVGRALLKPAGAAYVLTERGESYWNYVTRGLLTSHVAGYNPLLIQLGPLLRKEISLEDPALDRLGRLVALGASYTLSGSGMVQWVMKELERLGGSDILDLGCGAGNFLIQLALSWPQVKGVGVDMSASAIAEARKRAQECGLLERLSFHTATVSAQPMSLSAEVVEQVEVLTAMYMLHEFGGRGGADNISSVIAALRRQFPGRKLLMLEGTRANPIEMCEAPPRSFSQLDYSFIHPLSRQGPLRTPDEWQQIIENAGAKLLDRIPGFKLVASWISMYIVGLD
ncbi:MAG: class I SAM-dependent methyltransferase [Bryobacteraceae bacterium]|jgi:SAM-dependent methyltransferase